MKKWFCAALTIFLLSVAIFGIGGYSLNIALMRQKRQLADVGMKVSQTQQLMFDLGDFWSEYWWLLGLALIFPSLAFTVVLGTLLKARRQRVG